MFIFLSKLLPLFVYPLGLACALLLLALAIRHRHGLRTGLIIAAILILWLASTTGFSNLLARSLEYRYPSQGDYPAADVAVVLGGGTEPASSPRTSVEVNGAGDRVLFAAQLYQQGKTGKLLLSGGEIAWMNEGTSTPADDMAAILTMIGVPEDALILETESKNTYENALYCKEILDTMDVERVLLVTSAMHMPRAVALFEKQGVEVIPVPVDYSITDNESTDSGESRLLHKLIDIIPQSGNLSLTTNALKEYLGFFVYNLRGWL
jgi:uncharacterized SAM-binding protein YcdF (DUF218 family)